MTGDIHAGGDGGSFGLLHWGVDAACFIVRRMAAVDIPAFVKERVSQLRAVSPVSDVVMDEVGADVRTLSIKYREISGERFRSFDECAALLTEVDFPDWPVDGPRTARWLVEQISRSAAGPVSRHSRWVTEAEIPTGDRAKHEHEVLSRMLELATTYDGFQVGNLACFEVLSRRLQLIEESHAENPSAPNYTGSSHYMGSVERRGGALLAPTLQLHVAGKLRDEAAIAKEQRKAVEVRQLQRPGNQRPKTGADGK